MQERNSVLTNEEIEQAFQHGNASQISQTLVTLALNDPDRTKVEKYCLDFLEHPDASIRADAATCIAHLARIHQQLDLDLVLPALYRHQSDSGKYVAGNVNNALDDIEIFMRVPVKHDPSMVDNRILEVKEEEEEEEEEEEKPLTTEEIEQAFHSGNTFEISRTLTALALHDPDWRKVETYCLEFLEHPDDGVRGDAAGGISFLVCEHKKLDLDLVLPALYRHRSDPSAYVVKKVNYALIYIANILNVPIQSPEKEYVSVGPEPTNGGRALDNSVSIQPGNTRYRIGVDLNIGEIVVFGEMEGGKYSGDVRTWNQLTQIMREALIDNGLILENGSIILRDARGNIVGYGKNVIKEN
jgi:hypothetical protein